MLANRMPIKLDRKRNGTNEPRIAYRTINLSMSGPTMFVFVFVFMSMLMAKLIQLVLAEYDDQLVAANYDFHRYIYV